MSSYPFERGSGSPRGRAAVVPGGSSDGTAVEAAWLRLAAGPAGHGEPAVLRELIRATHAWPGVIARLEAERLAPQAAAAVARLPSSELPSDAATFVADVRKRSAARGLLAAARIADLVGRLERAGVPALTFKGPVLAARMHGDPGCRAFGDVDLLVPRASKMRAVAALIGAGLEPLTALPRSTASPLRSGQACHLRGPDSVEVDLHWGLSSPSFRFLPCEATLWRRRELVPCGPFALPTFNAEDTLLHACYHGAKHDWERWSHVADVAGVVGVNCSWDWQALQARASQTGLGRVLHVGLLLADDLIGLPSALDLLGGIGPDAASRRVAREIGAGLRASPPARADRTTRALRRALQRSGWVDRGRDALGKIIASFDAARPAATDDSPGLRLRWMASRARALVGGGPPTHEA